MKKYTKLVIQILFLSFIFCGCKSTGNNKKIPTIGFLDLLQDETLAQANKGFFDALKENHFSEADSTLKIIYRNAQNDQTILAQACDYLISQKPDLIATNPSLSTAAVVQKTKDIPVFMMVSPSPKNAGLTDKQGNAPANLFGVYETLDYIDTSLSLINKLLPKVKKIGAIYNQAESQSVDAFNRMKQQCEKLNLKLEVLPVNNSGETQLAMEALVSKKIEAFFALPDNTVFASFETIAQVCEDHHIPVFTSEAGLVARGALVSYGADFYQWGHQSGEQAAIFLRDKSTSSIKPEVVKVRKLAMNDAVAKKLGIDMNILK